MTTTESDISTEPDPTEALKAEHHEVLQGLRDEIERILRKSKTEGVLVHGELTQVLNTLDAHGTRGTPYTANEGTPEGASDELSSRPQETT